MEERRARLAALAARAGRTENIFKGSSTTVESHNDDDEEMRPPPKRSRTTSTEKKKEKTALEIALERAQAELIMGGATPSLLAESDGPSNPQQQYKINWDLKRDIQPSLDLLERRTQKAIVQLLRERLESEVQDEEGADEVD